MVAAVETMAYAGAVPWHGEGNPVSPDVSVDEMAVQAGLTWSVSKRPVQFKGYLNDERTFKDRFVLARDSDDRPFAVVSGRYKPVQPKEILDVYRELTQRYGMKLSTAGSLQNGSKVWALAETGRASEILGVPLNNYLNIVTSYDLSLSTLAYFTSVYVVCQNTLQASFGDMQNRIVIPHTREFNVKDVQDQIGLGEVQWQSFVAACDTLSKIKIDAAKAHDVLKTAYEIPENPELAQLDSDRIHVAKVYDMFTGRQYLGGDLSDGTMWGLLNAQTEYIDHRKRALNRGNRLSSSWYGDGFNVKQRTFDTLMQLAA